MLEIGALTDTLILDEDKVLQRAVVGVLNAIYDLDPAQSGPGSRNSAQPRRGRGAGESTALNPTIGPMALNLAYTLVRVACQPADLQPEHDSHLAQTDRGNQLLETLALARGPGLTEVAVDDDMWGCRRDGG